MSRTALHLIVIVTALSSVANDTAFEDPFRAVLHISMAQTGGSLAPARRIAITSPVPHQKARGTRGSDGVVRFEIKGTSENIPARMTHLMWVKPVRPAGDGWYLQRPPSGGIESFDARSWNGVGQLGSLQWPARDGDVFDVAITAVDDTAANRFLRDRQVVVRYLPVGSVRAVVESVELELR